MTQADPGEHAVTRATATRRTFWSALHATPAFVAGAIAFVWFLALSGWLGVKPGAPLAERRDVLFNSDTGRTIARLTDPAVPEVAGIRFFVHPFEVLVWRPACRVVVRALQLVAPLRDARVLASRFLVALIGAIGVTCLSSFALAVGLELIPACFLLAAYLLFTANVLVAVPENEGISSGLLMTSFWVWSVFPRSWRKTVVLTLIAIATAGTTITNGLFVVLCIMHERSRSVVRTFVIGSAVLIGLVGLTFMLVQVSWSVKYYVYSFTNGRLLHHKIGAALYAIAGLFYPAVGAKPHVTQAPCIPGFVECFGWSMVSYEPFDLGQFSGLPAISAVAWLVLLIVGSVQAIRDQRTKGYACVLLLWVAFNLLLHNVWGDEFFLYSPHWAWALMALVVMGVRNTRTALVVAAVLAMVPGQLQTISQIRAAVQSVLF